MSVTPDELATQVYGAIMDASNYSERSQQSADFRVGVSDLGYCSEKLRRMIAGIPEPPTDKLQAFIGTAIGDHVEQACMGLWPDAIRQAEVTVTLFGDGGEYRLRGHPDLILPSGLLIDFKTARGLALAERAGPTRQQQFQRHCYALAAYENDLFDGDVTLDDIQVANVYLDRAGDEHRVYVNMEPYSPEVVEEAAMWLDDVTYAYMQGEEARKEPPREVCAATCGHFATCRALDTDVEGLITDKTLRTAAELYRDGLDLEKQGRQMKDEAKAALTGISGSTGKFTVRWVHVNESEVHFTRAAYDRLDVKPMT